MKQRKNELSLEIEYFLKYNRVKKKFINAEYDPLNFGRGQRPFSCDDFTSVRLLLCVYTFFSIGVFDFSILARDITHCSDVNCQFRNYQKKKFLYRQFRVSN